MADIHGHNQEQPELGIHIHQPPPPLWLGSRTCARMGHGTADRNQQGHVAFWGQIDEHSFLSHLSNTSEEVVRALTKLQRPLRQYWIIRVVIGVVLSHGTDVP